MRLRTTDRRISIVEIILTVLTLMLLPSPHYSFDDQYWKYKEIEMLDYKSYLSQTETLKMGNIITQTHILEDKYPDLVPNLCGKEVCRTFMFEITNQFVGERSKANLETILLVGGFSGKERLGITVLINLITFLQKSYQYEKEIFQMANGLRLLVIPSINLQGLYKQSATEERIFVDLDRTTPETVLPKLDFNLLPEGPCFKSFSAQVLSKLHTEYTIMGGLLLSGGDNTITYPNLKQWFFGSKITKDEDVYSKVADALKNTINRHLGEGLEPITHQNLENLENTKSSNTRPTYIHWAFAGSSYQKFLSKKCFIEGSSFAKDYVQADQKSNRAFMMDLSLGKGKDYSKFKGKMGNLNYMIDLEAPESKAGLVNAGLMGIRHFLEIMKPYVLFKKMDYKTIGTFVEKKVSLIFDIKVKGCLKIDKVEIIKPLPTNIRMSLKPTKTIYTTPSINWYMDLDYFADDLIEKNHYYDFQFKITCDSNIDSDVTHYEAESHFVRSKLNDDFELRRNGSVFYSIRLDQLMLFNYRPDRMLKGYLIYSKNAKRQIVTYELELDVQLGRYFPAKLVYDAEQRTTTLKMRPEMVPPLPQSQIFENITQDFGILNFVEDTENNENFMKQMQLFRLKEGQEILLNILSSNAKEAIQNVDFDAGSTNNPILNSIMQVYNKKTRIRNVFSRFFQNKEMEMLPSIFIDLLGRKAEIIVYKGEVKKMEKEATTLKKVFSEVRKGIQGVLESQIISRMVGTMVIQDKTATPKVLEDHSLSPFPDSQDFRGVFPHGLIKLPPNGVFCSSVNTYSFMNIKDFKQDEDFESFTDKQSFKRNISFYALNITYKFQQESKGLITLYTTNHHLGELVFLNHQRAEFTLIRSNKNVFLRDLGGGMGSFMNIYQSEFDSSDLSMLGVFVMIFNQTKIKPSFNCFTIKNVEEFSITNEWSKYMKLIKSSKALRNGNDLVERLNYVEKGDSKKFYEQQWFLITLIVVLLVLSIIGGVVFFIQETKEEERKLARIVESN